MKSVLAILTFVGSLVCVHAGALAQEGTRHIALRSTYLSSPIERFRQFSIVGDLSDASGRARLELNPNSCTLSDFGDTEICTEIAPRVRTVQLLLQRRADELGLNRQLWVVTGAPLNGVLYLIVPSEESGSYRLTYVDQSGARTVIALERLAGDGHYNDKAQQRPTITHKEKCSDLAQTVDNVEAAVDIRPGTVNDTYFLIINGKKPHANTWVELNPAVYVRQPEYWRIDVKECSAGNILLPAVMPYTIDEEITHEMGTKGIELHWANGDVQRIDKP